jgi:hypothetical protein
MPAPIPDFELPRLKVFPNPWLSVHPTKGPQAAVMVDPAGRDDGPVRWVGAEMEVVRLEERKSTDPRGHRQFARLKFPSLKAGLLSGDPIELPDTGYYRRQLQDGALVPADDFTRSVSKARFADLAAAKAAGVAELESNHPGRWAQLAKHFGFDGSAPVTEPTTTTTTTETTEQPRKAAK